MRRGFKLFTKLLIISLIAISLFGCNKKEETVAITEVDTQEAYRTISISSIEGSAHVVRKSSSDSIAAYEGMSLYDGDSIVVDDNSNLVIDVDSDKHLLAEAGTSFSLSAEGTEELNNTKINLLSGSVLCEIDEKLKDGESFDVVTASSTMCVRGTVFRVASIKSITKDAYDMVEVFDGKVWSNIDSTQDELTLEPGQCALIRNANEEKEAAYISANQINTDSWDSDDFSFVVDESIEADGSLTLPIAYNKLPSVVVDHLVTITDSGKELSISKEELSKVSEITHQRDDNAGDTSANKQVVIPGVIYDEKRSTLNDHICDEIGHTIILVNGVKQCTICGTKFNDDYVESETEIANTQAFKEETGIGEIKFDFTPKTFSFEIPITADVNSGSNKENDKTDENKTKQDIEETKTEEQKNSDVPSENSNEEQNSEQEKTDEFGNEQIIVPVVSGITLPGASFTFTVTENGNLIE